jgi:uncharacterized membrane protein
MNVLIAASAAFFFLHMLPGTRLRSRLIVLGGEQVYLALFSLASACAIWWMVHTFNAAPYGGKLWVAPAAWQWLKAAVILFAYILIICGMFTPNPYTPGAANIPEKGFAGDGIFAITRHPLMWGIAIWAFAHMISQPNLRGFAFFGGFAATALIGSWLQQRRKRAGLPGWAAFEAKTSFWPFAAMLEGRTTLSIGTIGWWKIAVAAGIWALLLYFHQSWFGAQPLPLSL